MICQLYLNKAVFLKKKSSHYNMGLDLESLSIQLMLFSRYFPVLTQIRLHLQGQYPGHSLIPLAWDSYSWSQAVVGIFYAAFTANHLIC